MNWLFSHEELRKLWPFYLASFVSTLVFFAPAFTVVYFLAVGIGVRDLSILVALGTLASLFTELPTGVFADV